MAVGPTVKSMTGLGGGNQMMASLRRAVMVGLGVWIAWSAAVATAGPARYDPETRSMRFTYTYASLAPGQFGEAAIGSPQKPSSDQDAVVRTVVLKVSDTLSKATAGRLKISSLDLVSDARRADVVISLTGDPGRGGWAIAGAIEGRPGQIGLYYQVLAAEWEQDYVLTAAHEVCHYVFGLVDEYNFPQGCPLANPGGPGCLMDNYLSQGSRHGWYGRFCAHDHVVDNSQKSSCQAIIDKFFTDRNVTSAAEEGQSAQVASAGVAVSTRESKLENITRAAIGRVREEVEATNKDRKPSAALASVGSSKIRDVARNFLKNQLQANGVNLETDELRGVVESVLKQAGALVSVAVPPQFQVVESLIAKFAASRAKELKENAPKGSEKTLRGRLVRDVLAFLSGMGGASAPGVGKAPSADERQYLDFIAMQALAQVEQKQADQELYQAALTHIKLDRETAGTILDIATQVGVPGAESRLAALGEIDADLRTYIPGRTASTGFGRRRTILIYPEPLDPRKDYVVTQSGIYRYGDLLEQYIGLFTKLVERAQIDLYSTSFQERRQQERRQLLAKPASERATLERQRRIAELSDPDKARGQRESDLRTLIGEVTTAIRENRIENVMFLVPPGGIPRDMNTLFEGLRRQLLRKGDVRIDLVLASDADIPFELRDVAIGSGGSIITLTDVDEVGAVAQRLKNDQTSGAWVILPYQDVIEGADYTYAKTRRNVSWLRSDLKRASVGPEPLLHSYYNSSENLYDVIDFFKEPPPEASAAGAVPGRAAVVTPPAAPSINGSDHASTLLDEAKIMPVSARRLFVDYIQKALGDNEPRSVDEVEAMDPLSDQLGLLDELTYIKNLIVEYNSRPDDDVGVRQRFDVIEHVIRARAKLDEVRGLLGVALAAHEPYLARDYDENAFVEELKDDGDQEQAPASRQPAPVEERNGGGGPAAPGAEKAPDDDVKTRSTSKMINKLKLDADKIRESIGRPAKAQVDRPETNEQAEVDSAPSNSGSKNARNDRSKLDQATRRLNYLDQRYDDLRTIRQSFYKKIGDKSMEYERRIVRAVEGISERMSKYESSPATRAYLGLMLQQVRLQIVNDFLSHIEHELSEADQTSVFRRINRDSQVRASQMIQDKIFRIDGNDGVPRPVLPPADIVDAQGRVLREKGRYRLPRFYADDVKYDPKQPEAEFELILGFSQPLPGVDADAIRDGKMDRLPRLSLYNDDGRLLNTPSLRLDRDVSSPTCLIYRFAPEFGEKAWYNAALILNETILRRIAADQVHFTFSVASTRPNVRLNAALVQMPDDPDLVPPPPRKGLVRAMDRRAKLEVQVYGGTSVLGASISGVLHKIDSGSGTIEPIAQDFYDDGQTYGDRSANDGVYTSIVSLDQSPKGMEYRVFVQAESTSKSHNIPPEDPGKNEEARRKDARSRGATTVREQPVVKVETPESKPALQFQRATSIQIRVEP